MTEPSGSQASAGPEPAHAGSDAGDAVTPTENGSETVTRAPQTLETVQQTAAPTEPAGASDRWAGEANEAEPLIRFGRYEVRKTLGEGAFGTVYLAHDPQLDRPVALKVPRAGVLQDADDVERFLREARALATVNHPNVCAVYDVGDVDGRQFIVMAFVQGRPLSDYVGPKSPFDQRQAAILVRKIALALDAAHRKGVIHRDLKPANIMLDGERHEPIVMDFGLARRTQAQEARLTQSGTILGTPAYMSPEQAAGEAAGIQASTDLYSLGVILYELICGSLPFEGSAFSVIAQVLRDEPPKPSEKRSTVDPRLEAICLKAMSKDPAARYASMREFADALTSFLQAKLSESKVPRRSGEHPVVPPSGGGSATSAGRMTKKAAATTDPELKVRPAARADGDATSAKLSDSSPRPKRSGRTPRTARSSAGRPTSSAGLRTRPLPPAEDEEPSGAPPWMKYALVGVGGLVALVVAAIVLLSSGSDKAASSAAQGLARLHLQGAVDQLALSFELDGEPLERSRLDGPLELPAGTHELRVLRGEIPVTTQSFSVAAKTTTDLAVFIENPAPAVASMVIARGGNLSIRAGSATVTLTDSKQIPSGGFDIERIDFAGSTSFRPDDLKLAAGVLTIREIDLANTAADDATLTSLKWLPGLETLDLTGTKVTDSGLAALSALPALKSLRLEGTGIGDAGMNHLASLQTLNDLSLAQTSLADAGLGTLEALNGLKALDVTKTPVSEVAVDRYKKAVAGCKVSHEVFSIPEEAALAEWVIAAGGEVELQLEPGGRRSRVSDSLPEARYRVVGVWLKDVPRVDQADLARLGAAPALEFLSLTGATADGLLEALKNAPALERLELLGSRPTQGALASLASIPALSSVSVDGGALMPAGTPPAAALLPLAGVPALRELVLAGPQIGDAVLEGLSSFSALERLELRGTGTTDAGLAHVATDPKLKSLVLSQGTPLTDAGVAHLTALANLEELRAPGTEVSDAAVASLVQLTALKELDVAGTRFTHAGAAQLKAALPACDIIGGRMVRYAMDVYAAPVGGLPAGWTGDAAIKVDSLLGARGIVSSQLGSREIVSPQLKLEGDFFVQLEVSGQVPSFTIAFDGPGGQLPIAFVFDDSIPIVSFGVERSAYTFPSAMKWGVYRTVRLERRGRNWQCLVDGTAVHSRAGGATPELFESSMSKAYERIRLAILNPYTCISELETGPLPPADQRPGETGETERYALNIESGSGSLPSGWSVLDKDDTTGIAKLRFAGLRTRGDFSLELALQYKTPTNITLRMLSRDGARDLPLHFDNQSANAWLISIPEQPYTGISHVTAQAPNPVFTIQRKGTIFSVYLDGKLTGTLRSNAIGDFSGITFHMNVLSCAIRGFRVGPAGAAPTSRSLAPPPGDVQPDPGSLGSYRDKVGRSLYFQVTGNTGGSLWGTGVYTDDSTLATAAVHAGVLRPGETGIVKVTILPGQLSYGASVRNGVTSSSWGEYSGSFRVAAVDWKNQETPVLAPAAAPAGETRASPRKRPARKGSSRG
ncbi:MAG: protein kinase [Planctomycetes bacterium]|nr:protein kinase [Planctomycetota bacterium]